MKEINKIIFLFICIFSSINVVFASDFRISASSYLTKGTTTKLTIKGTDVTGRFDIKTSNANVVSVSESGVWIENNSYGITLSALNVGTATITVTPKDISDGSGKILKLSPKTIKVTVSLPREKSSDNNLKSLSVEGYEISPAFNKNELNYTVIVEEGTKTIKINATPNESHAKITGTGEKELIPGVNSLNIVVTSETGVDKIYNLTVNVIDKDPINVVVDGKNYTMVKLKENITCSELFELGEMVVENFTVPVCKNEKIDYTLVGLKDEEGNIELFRFKDNKYTKYEEIKNSNLVIIPKEFSGKTNYTKDKIKINDKTYEVYKTKKSKRFVLIYAINVETGEEGFYNYDTKNNTFNYYDNEYIDYLIGLNNTYLLVLGVFSLLILVLIICLIKTCSKKKRKDNKDNVSINIKDKKKKKEKVKENEVKETSIKENEIKENIIDEENEATTYDIFETKKKKKK